MSLYSEECPARFGIHSCLIIDFSYDIGSGKPSRPSEPQLHFLKLASRVMCALGKLSCK